MKYSLHLYVTGQTGHSQVAIYNLTHICEQLIPGHYEIEVVDVLENPQRAEDEKILATPTLIRHRPQPRIKLVGDLSDHERVIIGLGLSSLMKPSREL